MRRLLTVSAVVSGAGAAVYKRAQHLAETEQRPIGDVISSLPGRIAADLRTLPDDLRTAAEEAKDAASRKSAEVDEDFRRASQP